MLNSIIIKSFILYALLILGAWGLLSENNIIGSTKGTKKAKNDVDTYNIELNKKKRLEKFLNYCCWISKNIGFLPTEQTLSDIEYRITRLNFELKLLKRSIEPIELIGLFRGINVIGIFLTILSITLTFKITGIVFLTLCLSKKIFLLIVDLRIAKENEEIEKEFPNLYLKLYTRLLKGGHVRIAPALDDYIKSISKGREEIKRFAMNYRNYIELYPDEIAATEKLKRVYNTVTIARFCTLVKQALNDVDNKDSLLTFKMELLEKKKREIERNGEKIRLQGRSLLIVVFIILGEVFLLSLVAKVSMIFNV
ncbi:hypothetical protein [Clostridioides difficile]|uniref:hypothetical protein n=1 Tax=Clostridioides difficile TaxID=1496 RepID=UPI001034D02B|nr:hypothetical protein [Clostridioides difficile]MDM9944136.1 hypothetical protein [Clostridioides difficile]